MSLKMFLTFVLLPFFASAVNFKSHRLDVKVGEVYTLYEENIQMAKLGYDNIYLDRENKILKGVQLTIDGKKYQFQSMAKNDLSTVKFNKDSVQASINGSYINFVNALDKEVLITFSYFSYVESWKPIIRTFLDLDFTVDSSSESFSIEYQNQKSDIKAGDKINLGHNLYSYGIQIIMNSSAESLLSYTVLNKADLSGSYYHWKSKLPREVVDKFNKKKELIMLWRWNVPGSFVKNEFTLSGYGKEAVNQAGEIKKFIEFAFDEGEEVGLVHSIEDEIQPKVFALAQKEDLRSDSIVEYLEYWENSSNLNQIYNAKKGVISHSWSPSEVQKRKDPKEEFLNAINVSVALFGTDSNKLRTVLIMSVGPSGQADFTLNSELLKETLQGVTLKPVRFGGNWKGVDYSVLDSLSENEFSVDWQGKYGFETHSFTPDHYSYRAPHSSLGFKIIYDTANYFHEFGYTEGVLTKEIQFQGIDSKGNVMGEVTYSPTVSTSDSVLVPIAVYDAGGDRNGYIFSDSADRLLGFMDKQKSYEVYEDSAMLIKEEGGNFLPENVLDWDEEDIVLPVSHNLRPFGVYIENGSLLIPFDVNSKIEIFDFVGRKIDFLSERLNGFKVVKLSFLPRLFIVKYKLDDEIVWVKINKGRL
jgi:hypothetical protein